MKGTTTVSEANIRVPEETRDRLAMIAASEGLSLRAYLARLAETLLTPQERVERADKARAALREWTGHAPSAADERDLDAELNRRLAKASGR
jgi:hypothetical protein